MIQNMKLIIILLLIINPLLTYSQGATKTEIDWITLEKAEKFAKKYDKNILLFFYKPECEFCEKMKKETLSDPKIINLINTQFYPVKINGYTKDTIEFNGVIYGNQQAASTGRHDWRHDFYFKFGRYKDGIITPTISIINSKYTKTRQFTGFQSKPQLLRGINQIINQ